MLLNTGDLFIVCIPLPLAGRVAEVRFNARGITGYILFIETSLTSTRIIANLRGLSGKIQFSLVASLLLCGSCQFKRYLWYIYSPRTWLW